MYRHHISSMGDRLMGIRKKYIEIQYYLFVTTWVVNYIDYYFNPNSRNISYEKVFKKNHVNIIYRSRIICI